MGEKAYRTPEATELRFPEFPADWVKKYLEAIALPSVLSEYQDPPALLDSDVPKQG